MLLESKNRLNAGFPCAYLLNMLLLYTTLSGVGIDLGGIAAITKMLCRVAEHLVYAYRKILL